MTAREAWAGPSVSFLGWGLETVKISATSPMGDFAAGLLRLVSEVSEMEVRGRGASQGAFGI